MRMKLELEFDGSDEDVRKLATITRALNNCPPDGLEIQSGPITVHCKDDKKQQALDSVNVSDRYDKKDIEIESTDDPGDAILESVQKPKGQEKLPEPEDDKEQKRDLNRQARQLMKDLVSSKKATVKEIKETLTEKVGKDVTNFSIEQLKKAIEIMEGM